jgi:D-amino peptidase
VRVHVISDLEGVSGVVKGGQTVGGEPMFEEARKLYTEEINAAVRGARAAGATEIVVMDCHGAGKEWSFNSLVPDLLDPDCEFVVQEDWTEYTAFLEEGCDAALLVGMHAMAGARMGVMNHTVSGKDLHTLAADKLRFRPGVERVDDRTISVRAETWWEAWKAFYF